MRVSATDVRRLHADGEDNIESLASDGAMSIADGAAFLGSSRSYLYDLIQAGTIKTAKLGRHRVVLKRSLVQYLAKRTT